MQMVCLTRQRRLHFVGIGGAGMSGIAELCLKLGMRVSGCDLKPSATITRLASLGAEISQGHHPAHLKDDGGIDAVVISSAIKFSNPEVARAREMKIPVIARAEMLGELLRMAKLGVAVAGTHGKTTTTGLIALIMEEADLDPTVAVGGNIRNTGTNVRLGRGDFMVAEADESDASFLLLIPTIAVVTNIDPEHLDHYGTMDRVREAFAGLHQPRAVLWRRGARHRQRQRARTRRLDSQADADLRRCAGCGSARREDRDRRPLDALRGDSQGRTSRARDDTDARRARCAELAGGDRGRDGSWHQFRNARPRRWPSSAESAAASRSKAKPPGESCSTTTRIIRPKCARRWPRCARRSSAAWSRSSSRIGTRGCAICSTIFSPRSTTPTCSTCSTFIPPARSRSPTSPSRRLYEALRARGHLEVHYLGAEENPAERDRRRLARGRRDRDAGRRRYL